MTSDWGVAGDDGGGIVSGWMLAQALAWPVVIEMVNVLSKNSVGVACVVNQHPVGAFGADAADEPFRVAVCSGRAGRNLDDVDAFGSKDGVESSSELRVPVADEKTEGTDPVTEVHQEIAGGLGGPDRSRMSSHPEQMDSSGAHLHDEQDVQPAQPDGVERKKVGGQQPAGLGTQEGRPPGVATPGCRPSRAAAKIRRIVLAPTRCPSPTSSPWRRRYPQDGLSRARRSTRARI